MKFLIVTGISGAGKRSVMKMLEDMGYFCVDNLPVELLHDFARLEANEYAAEYKKIAIGVDVRAGSSLEFFSSNIANLKNEGYNIEILFLECSDEVLIHRYKETRRTHPLTAVAGRVEDAISLERDRLFEIKKEADYVIDTSQLLVRELKAQIDKIFLNMQPFENFVIDVISFGFKYGIPLDADLVFDVRFLPNPYYIDELKELTGNDKAVYDFVMSAPAAKEFLDKLTDMVKFLIPHYIEEGKNQIVIAIGCTGGKHRSVTLANALADALASGNSLVKRDHRDADKKKK